MYEKRIYESLWVWEKKFFTRVRESEIKSLAIICESKKNCKSYESWRQNRSKCIYGRDYIKLISTKRQTFEKYFDRNTNDDNENTNGDKNKDEENED